MKATVYYQSLSCENLACEHLTHQVAKKTDQKGLSQDHNSYGSWKDVGAQKLRHNPPDSKSVLAQVVAVRTFLSNNLFYVQS